MNTTSAYGFWDSPLTAASIAAGSRRLGSVQVDGEFIYWTEADSERPGCRALLRAKPGMPAQAVLPEPVNVRTRVHEYGGGEYLVQDGTVYFADDEDQSWYCHQLAAGEDANAVPALVAQGATDKSTRYADASVWHHADGACCLLVRERHGPSGQVDNDLVLITISHEDCASTLVVLASGHDFYASPRFSPDGKKLCFLAWDHPNMPWDGCYLYEMMENAAGEWGEAKVIAGSTSESIYQPSYSKAGQLIFISDRSDWWNLYSYDEGTTRCLLPMEAEFGLPHWVFATKRYLETDDGKIIAVATVDAMEQLFCLEPESGQCERLACPYTSYGCYLEQYRDGIVFLGGKSDRLPEVVYFDLSAQEATVLRRESDVALPIDYVSVPKSISVDLTTHVATESGPQSVQAFFYPPHNPEYQPDTKSLPPLVVMSHGGPTAMTDATLNLKIQYWTTRGFAVVDVNYGGSTGFGKAYQQRLQGQWAVVDVQDCLACVQYLIDNQCVDANKVLIRGSSAGGLTTLAALTASDAFAAGTSIYGVGDLEAMAQDTHKFEACYMDQLVGPYPEQKKVYEVRSPINNLAKLKCPVLLLQGSDDKVVPPEQSRQIAKALAQLGIAYQYEEFPREGHGFRHPEAIAKALEIELAFYKKVLNSEL